MPVWKSDSERKSKDTVLEGEIVPRGERVLSEHARPAQQVPLQVRRRKRSARLQGCWGNCAFFGGLSFLVLTIVFSCLLVVMVVGVVDFMRAPLDNFLSVFGFDADAEPEVVDSRTIVLGIREMALLQTAIGDIQISKTVIDSGAAPDAELRVNYIGQVTAGIDLAQITEESVVTNPDGSITVTLPPAQLTGCYLGKPDVVHRSCTDIPLMQDCGKIVEGMEEEAYDRALVELRETAYEMNLLDLAYQQAEGRIYDLMAALGYERVSFERGAGELAPDQTCLP